MGAITTAAKDLQTEMKTAGLKRVWLSRKDAQPPGYLIALDKVDYVLAGGVFELTLVVYAVSPDVDDDERALAKLDDLHADFIAAGFHPEGTTTVVGLNLPSAAKPAPALRMALTTST